MLSPSRVVLVGESPYSHEQDAIEFAKKVLPDVDPYNLWALLELVDPSTGRLHEIDMLVLGYSALYLIEVKSGPGKYEGDTIDWYWTPPGGRSRYMDPPFKLANHKAKVLKSRLRSKMEHPENAPWIEALVFLSDENPDLRFNNYGDLHVVTRKTFLDAVKKHEFPGAERAPGRINQPVARDVAKALRELGIRQRKGKAHAGSYELGEVIGAGAGYEDRVATHQEMKTVRRRARIYLVPQQTTIERRQQLLRAADREFQVLHELREHPGILRVNDLVSAPLGQTVLFDEFDGGIPLDAFLRANPGLSFIDRAQLVLQIGEALAYCHDKRIVHNAVSPAAVLVRRNSETAALEARLFNFQLAASKQVEGTSHWSALAEEPWALYQAPELRVDPERREHPQTDIFSLGALAHFVFTGKPPGVNLQEIETRLKRDGSLDPRAVSDGIPAGLAEVIKFATYRSTVERADEVRSWLDLLEGEVTAPPEVAPAEKVDPLKARKDDDVGEDLRVVRTLGSGATSRVLLVQKEDRQYALKVSLGPDHDDRLKAEAQVLRKFEHGPIVRLVDEREIGERVCLLLSLAGDMTLQSYLAKEGTVSLDYASRYGEDLLQALEHLEEERVTHRDIKPANLGVGSTGKGRMRMVLFDFSLTAAPDDKTTIGTAAYRDPHLSERGHWDAAADRWSAAVTLHEMLTGIRPRFKSNDGTDALATDPDAVVVIAAERFDPAVRDRLSRFFVRSLSREVNERFSSATDMRRQWIACFAEEQRLPPEPPVGSDEPSPEPPPVVLPDEAIAAIGPEALVASLPLTNRAKNALDRAGALTARDLLGLPDNKVSAVRGVGQRIALEIVEFRRRWTALRDVRVESSPFFPGYRGSDFLVMAVGLPAAVSTALQDAGLRTLRVVAEADTQLVTHVISRAGSDTAALRKVLDDENRAANERAHPSTVEGWLAALRPKQKVRAESFELLLGLREPFLGRLDVSIREVAEARKSTPPNEYIHLSKARDEWLEHGALSELRQLARAVATRAGGAARIDVAADELRAMLPHDQSAGDSVARARAAALLRIVTEVEREDEGGLRWVRSDSGLPWLCETEAHAEAVTALGALADELADRPVLASPGETARLLSETAIGSPLAAQTPDRLAEIAALASRNAARSPRLEIYPRNMPAVRALDLCSAVLTGSLPPAAVHQRVRARYPEASPLPDRPELDRLLEPYRLEWNAVASVYERPGEAGGTALQTHAPTHPTAPTVLPTQPRGVDAGLVREQEFSERLQHVIETRAFRVLGVTADRAHIAALAIARRFGVKPISIDRELVRRMMQKNVKPDLVHSADREGPNSRAWPNLLRLAEKAAEELAAELLPSRQPLLLIQPGLLARFELTGFLQRLVEASQKDESAAMLLLVPSHDDVGVPRINGTLTIPGILPTHAFRVSKTWLKKHAPEAA